MSNDDLYHMMAKYLAKRLDEDLRPECPDCGAKLSHYWYYGTDGSRMQNCKACGKMIIKGKGEVY